MLKKSLIIGGLLTLAVHHLHAQTTPPVNPHGVWTGKFTSNHGTAGTLKITVTHDSVVNATMEFDSTVQVPPSSFKSITHSGNNVTWTQDLIGHSCEGTGTFSDDKLKGEITCGPAIIKFEVQKK